MLSPAVAGRIMIGIGIFGLVASVVGGVIARQLVTDFEQGVEQSLALSAEVLETVDDSFDAAADALAIVTGGVSDAQGAVEALGRSMEQGRFALDALTVLTGIDIADALDTLESTLPAVEQAATTIDRTLATLSALPFGPSYSPDRPFGETIGDLRESIAGLPDELREQSELAGRTIDELTSASERTTATAASLARFVEGLEVVSDLIAQYAERTADAREVIEEQRDVLAASAARARLLIVGFSGLFALGQFVPLYLGLALSRGELTSGSA